MNTLNKNRPLSSLEQPLLILLGAFLLCIPAVINGFPFLYADTGTYIHIGFTENISGLRPLLYGIFLRHISLAETFWLVILAQGLLVSYTLFRFTHFFFPAVKKLWVLAIIFILTAATSIGVVSGMLMPDIFAPLLFLISFLLLFARGMARWEKISMGILLWFCITCHHSHPYILIMFLLAAALGIFLLRNKMHLAQNNNRFWKRFTLVTLIAVLGYFSIPSLHYLKKGEFMRSESTNIFLLGRLNQMNFLEPFLEEECPNQDWNLCNYKNEIPEDFLWSSESPVYKDRLWSENNKEYGKVAKAFFKKPKNLIRFLGNSTQTSVRQFFSFNTVVIVREDEKGYPYQIFQASTPWMIPDLESSKQFNQSWSSAWLNGSQKVLVYSSFILALIFLTGIGKWKASAQQRLLLGYVLLFLVCNATFCASISMEAPRFQSRVVWLLPFLILLIAGNLVQSRKSS